MITTEDAQVSLPGEVYNERGNAGFVSTIITACLPITETRPKLTLFF